MIIKSAERMREISNNMNKAEINGWTRHIIEEIENVLFAAEDYGGYYVKIPFVGMPKNIFNSMIKENLKDLIKELRDKGYDTYIEEEYNDKSKEKVDFKISISW